MKLKITESHNSEEEINVSKDSVIKLSVDELVEKFMPFAQAIVNKVSKSMQLPPHLKEEFYSAAYYGLVEAATRFNWSLEIPFERFAYIRVKGAVIDYIRSCSDLSSAAYRYARKLQSLQEVGRVNGLDYSEVGLAQDQLDTSEQAAQGNLAFRVSLCDLGSDSLELPADLDNPEQYLDRKQQQQNLWNIVASLPKEQADIIEQYYLRDVSFTDIASGVSECSKSWVCRLHQKALLNLKDKLEV